MNAFYNLKIATKLMVSFAAVLVLTALPLTRRSRLR